MRSMIRSILLLIISSPLLVIFIVFDIIKLPVVIFLFLPISLFLWIINMVKGYASFRDDVLDMLWTISIMGMDIYLTEVWDKSLW